MDRKNLFLALACFGGALALYIFGTPRQVPAPAAAPVVGAISVNVGSGEAE